MVAPPVSEYGPSIEPALALKLAFSALTDRPVLESLKLKVPFSTTTRPTIDLASGTEGATAQFGLPWASISSAILGPTSTTSAISTSPIRRASSEGFTMTDFASSMSAVFEPGMLGIFTLSSSTRGVGSSDRRIGPSRMTSRPVARLACATISGL